MSLCKSKDFTENFVILTPNQRLSTLARERDNQQKLTEHRTTWEPRLILPLQQWMLMLNQTLIQQGHLAPRLFLNSVQAEILWAQIIHQENNTLSHFSSSAVQAWELLHQWDISLQDTHFFDTEMTKLWQSWAVKFQVLLKKNQWQDHQTALNQTLIYLESLNKDFLNNFLPRHIILLGFTNFTIFEKKFLDILHKLNITITEDSFIKTPDVVTKKAFDSEEAELEALAQWAYAKSALGNVGCVIPRLSRIKDKIIAVFERYSENKNILNISLGNALNSYPLIHAAITGLKLLDENLSFQIISDFLLSPFYDKSLSHLSQRSLLDIKLKSKLNLVSTKSDLLKILGKHPLKKFFGKTLTSKIVKTFSEWREFFETHLHFLGWPGERILSSEEFQLLSHWESLLENFTHLRLVSPTHITFHEALEKLIHLAEQTIFQSKRSPEAKIDILGILEAAGLPFDYLWIAGLEENTWPAKGLPNPFLPLSLQKKLNMPHSSIEQDLKFCSLITQQLLTSANEIIVSYPKIYQDNPVYPSILINTIPELNLTLPIIPKLAEKNKISFIWEKIIDHQGPLLDLKNSKNSYGSELFKDQAACPFRAFAKHRLKAKKIELPQLGYTAITRGQFVHKILEQFFKIISDQQKLNLLSQTDLYLLLDNLIEKLLTESHHTIFTQVEKKRLFSLISEWLDQEKKRDFFTVISTEETLKIHFSDLPLNLRIDRIDQIGENKYLIIDYKTGKINFNPHSIEDEPQLPLYSVVSGINIDSIGFAQLRQNNMKFKPFPAEKSTWEKALSKLANDFLQGHAAVKPKYGKETCQYCDLSALCRIKENL